MDGIIIIDKPKGWSSNDIVQKVKKISKEKVGHTGTLDPLATGVLPILIGKGTKISKYLINHDKRYIAKIKLGMKTTTADLEGEIIEEQKVNEELFNKENIEKTLLSFKGKIEQTPPIYSAIKLNGKKLYEYARKGEKIEIPKRTIEIYNIKLIDVFKEKKEIEYEVECSKGTYIRTLCEDIAKKLNTIGTMVDLKRIKVGDFEINQAINIEKLNEENISSKLIKFEDIFEKKEEINLESSKREMFLNGVKLNIIKKDGVYKVYIDDKFVGLGTIRNNTLKRDIILN